MSTLFMYLLIFDLLSLTNLQFLQDRSVGEETFHKGSRLWISVRLKFHIFCRLISRQNLILNLFVEHFKYSAPDNQYQQQTDLFTLLRICLGKGAK